MREIHIRERQRLAEEHQSHVALLEAEIGRLEVEAGRERGREGGTVGGREGDGGG